MVSLTSKFQNYEIIYLFIHLFIYLFFIYLSIFYLFIFIGRFTFTSEITFENWRLFIKWWKMLFISCKKLFLFSRCLYFCLGFLVMYNNGLIRKLRLISKFMTSQTGHQIITIHILPNIYRSNENQAMKFGQLIEYHVRNIFLQKLCRKRGRKTSSRCLVF